MPLEEHGDAVQTRPPGSQPNRLPPSNYDMDEYSVDTDVGLDCTNKEQMITVWMVALTSCCLLGNSSPCP